MSLLSDLREKRDDLEARIGALTEESKPIREQISNLDRTRGKLLNELGDVRQKITALAESPSVSDHAVIRYLERKHGFSFDDVRSQMLTPTVVAAMRSGVPSIKALDGTLIVKGMKVVTYAP